jgi:hypothetical protein
MEIYWERAEIQCPGCREVLVLRASLLEIWCPWYEVREASHRTDPRRIVLTLTKKAQDGH